MEDLWADGPDWRARRVAHMKAMERLHAQFPADDEVISFYALSLLSGAVRRLHRRDVPAADEGRRAWPWVWSSAIPKHPGATHYIIHAFDDPVHAPLALDAAHVYAEIVPAVSHAVHMPTHIFIQHGMWNEVAGQNVRAFNIARDLFQPGDAPNDMAHSGDWGQYGFLQLGDYAGARERISTFETVPGVTTNQRAAGALTLMRARYIIETEEWRVQPMAENASVDTMLANGMSAVKTGDLATAEKMAALLSARAGMAPAADGGGAHADHGAAPAAMSDGNPDAGKGDRVKAMELAALVAEAKGQKDSAIATLRDAVKVEESMRPPIGAADPIKPSHELLGEVLLRAGKPAEAAAAFDASLLRMPNRARALMGAAKAYAAAGNAEAAAARHKTLMSFWKGAPVVAPTSMAAAR